MTAHRALQRVLILAALASAALLAGAPVASAHVHVDADGAVPGEWAMLTFRVPNESESGALTSEFSVTLPAGTSAMTETMPGWTVKLDRDVAAGTVRSVTWTAGAGAAIAPDQFGLFRVSLTLPKDKSVSFPATQTYSDGKVVRWDQPTPPGGAEPEHPAPELTLTAAAAPSRSTSDPVARWLGIAGLIAGVAAIALPLVRRRRT